MERKVNNVEVSIGDKISYAKYKKHFTNGQRLGYIDSSTEMMSLEFYSDRRHKGSFNTAREAIDQVRYIPEGVAHSISRSIGKEMKKRKLTTVDYEGKYLKNVGTRTKANIVRESFKGTLDLSNINNLEHTISRMRGYEVYAIFHQLFGDAGIKLADEYYGY